MESIKINVKEQIRKELNEYLDKYIPRTEIDIYKHVVNFIKEDRKKQLTLYDDKNQREQLITFLMKVGDCYDMDQRDKAEICVDEILNR